VKVDSTKALQAGESVNLRPDIQPNYDYFQNGPGYWDGWQQHAK
jgi:hypothetical protein